MGVAEAFEAAIESLFKNESLLDVEIVLKTARRQGASTELRLMIDRPAGIDLALCESLAKAINQALRDQTDLYTLEVESAGLERPLVRETDYERFSGRTVYVRTHKLWEGAKSHRGILQGMREGSVVLKSQQGEIAIPFSMIKQANLEFDLRAALRRGTTDAPVGSSPDGKRA